jgi:hypothetical protein
LVIAFGSLLTLGGCMVGESGTIGDDPQPPGSGGWGDTQSDCGGPIILSRSPDGEDCKIEGPKMGQPGATIDLGTSLVTFDSWVAKANDASEYVGFTISVEGAPVDYVVKAGTDLYASSDTSWVHPAGTAGSKANAISNVDFCEDDDGDDDDDDGDDGGDGDGGDDDGDDDGDGCPDDDDLPYIE